MLTLLLRTTGRRRTRRPRRMLIEGLTRALYWQQLLDADTLPSASAIARVERLHHCVVNELLRLI